ncbi:gamma-glutamyl kinase [Brevirhabdus sp.]|uniref:gamma-glutamyl kinase n=1 Tax=Brevirhabdus sp. TaxID=2004514 RepID=UPI004058FCDC
MLVFWKENLVYLATPKTGTTAIEAELAPVADMVFRGPPGLKHTNVPRFENFVRPLLDRVEERPWEFVATVREPVDWLGSWFRYRQRPALDGKPNSTKGLSFAEFVTEVLSDAPPARSHLGSQSWFFNDAQKYAAATHLFAYDALGELVAFLEERLGRTITLKRRNASPSADLTLSAELRVELRSRMAEDFALYEAVKDATNARRFLLQS